MDSNKLFIFGLQEHRERNTEGTKDGPKWARRDPSSRSPLRLARKMKSHSETALAAAQKALDAAKKRDLEAAGDLKSAHDDLKAVHKKWELIEIDGDDDDIEKEFHSIGRKRSAQEPGVDIFEVETVQVVGCGQSEVNGMYKRVGMFSYSPQFVHHIKGNENIFLRRLYFGSWFISREGSTMYKCVPPQDSNENFSPVDQEWTTCKGTAPPPHLYVVDNCLKELEERNDLVEIDINDDVSNRVSPQEQNEKLRRDDVDIFGVKSIKVSHSGTARVNGTYMKTKMFCNGLPVFESKGGSIYLRHSAGLWFIMSGSTILYKTNSTDRSDTSLFDKEWITCSLGTNPTPKLQVKELL